MEGRKGSYFLRELKGEERRKKGRVLLLRGKEGARGRKGKGRREGKGRGLAPPEKNFWRRHWKAATITSRT